MKREVVLKIRMQNLKNLLNLASMYADEFELSIASTQCFMADAEKRLDSISQYTDSGIPFLDSFIEVGTDMKYVSSAFWTAALNYSSVIQEIIREMDRQFANE